MKKLPPAPLPRHDLLTPREVSAFLRISVQAVYRLIQDGMIPSLKVGLQYRIPRQKFLEWFEAAQESQAKTRLESLPNRPYRKNSSQ